MPRATNNDVLAAVAKLIECRDHRRGRKPSWNILIHTDDNGTVHIRDLITECSQVVGKRAYNKKHLFTIPVKATSEKRKKANAYYPTGPAVKVDKQTEAVLVERGAVRISPVTGKPVRPYKKRGFTPPVEPADPTPVTFKDSLLQNIAELKVTIAQAKLSRESAMQGNNTKHILVCNSIITDAEKKLYEAEKTLAAC